MDRICRACNNVHNYFFANPNNEINDCQMQKTLNKQKLTQKQDQKLSNKTLCELLSSAEMIAVKKSNNMIKRDFAAYDHFDTGEIKSIPELKIELFTRITLFNRSYKSYIRDHGEYKFPKNLNLQTIKNYIEYWERYVQEKEVINCLIDIYNILNCREIDADYWFNRADEIDDEINVQTQKGLIKKMKESAELVPRIREKNQNICEEVKENFEKNENFEINAKLNGNPGDLKNFIQQFSQKNKKGEKRSKSNKTSSMYIENYR